MKTNLLRILLCLIALLFSAGVYAGESKKEQFLNLTITTELGSGSHHGSSLNTRRYQQDGLTWRLATPDDAWCRTPVKTIFRDSSHPNSNPYHRFNENNGGIAMVCSEREDSNFYTIIGGVHNSRDGDAVFWGKGVRLKTPEFAGFSIGAGLELSLVYYGFDDKKGYQRVLENAPADLIFKLGKIPVGQSGYMIFPLPTLVYQVSYTWRSEYMTGRISFVERNLAGAAQLRGIELGFRINKDFL